MDTLDATQVAAMRDNEPYNRGDFPYVFGAKMERKVNTKPM